MTIFSYRNVVEVTRIKLIFATSELIGHWIKYVTVRGNTGWCKPYSLIFYAAGYEWCHKIFSKSAQ